MPELAPEGGASNSRLNRKSAAAGFDTLRFRFRSTPEKTWALFERGGWGEGARGSFRRTDDGVTVELYRDGLVAVEGRAAAMLEGSASHRLARPDELELAESAVRDRLELDDCEAALGRADVSSDLLFDDPHEGQAFLHALSRVDHPWLKVGTEGRKHTELETVYGRTARGRSVVFRCYDKGVETGDAPEGVWLRFERQRRWRKDREGTVAHVLGRGLGELFAGRELRALLSSDLETTVVDFAGSVQRVRELVWSKQMTPRTAELVLGYLALGDRHDGRSADTHQRRRAQLRRYGIAYDPLEPDRKTVAVADVLRAFTEPVLELVA